jgi:hypothetical protein
MVGGGDKSPDLLAEVRRSPFDRRETEDQHNATEVRR